MSICFLKKNFISNFFNKLNLSGSTTFSIIQNFIRSISDNKNSSKIKLVYKKIDISQYQHLIDEHTENKEKVEAILEQYEYLKYTTDHVPSDISLSQMSDMLTMNNEYQRKRYLKYLFLTEVRKLKDFNKREQKKVEYQNYLENRDGRNFGVFDQHGQLSYQLWGNSLISRIGSKNVSHLRTPIRLRYASMFGQKLVIDLDYDDYMSLSECRIQVRHIVQLLVNNLSTTNEPFDIYFTNCDYQKPTMKNLEKYYDSIPFQLMSLENHFLSKSYLDIFPRERLVYLTPNADKMLLTYNHDDIYIIGGFLDKSSLDKPLSYLKALQEGIRQYRLPLDKYVAWAPGSSKHLCIMHMVAILNQVKKTDNWHQAFRDQIPKRKMMDDEILKKEREQRQMAFIKRKLLIKKKHIDRNIVQHKLPTVD